MRISDWSSDVCSSDLGRAIDSRRLACPTLSIRSAADRIVPAAAAPEMAENATLNLGHVGMIVGGRARTMLWEPLRSEEHTSELQSLMRISYAVFCLKKTNPHTPNSTSHSNSNTL